MKDIFKKLIPALVCAALLLTGCTQIRTPDTTTAAPAETDGTTEEEQTYGQESAVKDSDITAEEATGDFSIETEDGGYSVDGSVYTVGKAGTYVLSGRLDGQIIVDAGAEDEVVLELNGVTISCGTDSPVKILSAAKVEISAKSGTENVINDDRSAKKTDDETQGEGAVYSKADLKLKGTGTLVINANYNNGVHTTKDLTIQKLSLKVTAYNNALKGNDSIKVLSGSVAAISTNGDGVKTENTNADANGKTRGDIVISGGSVTVYAAGDGFQAAHDFTLAAGEDGAAPAVTVYTGSYSGYTASSASTTSYKGVKVQNELNIVSGVIDIKSYDDGLHADYGTAFEDGTKGQGTINITGGTVTMSVYAPEQKTGGGRRGPGGWGGQKTVSGADAIHADYKLNISGGTVNIDSAYEGLEANVITVTGGTTYIVASDDGINACKGVTTPSVTVEGGYLDVTVSPNGDTDGIDSNGTYTQTGGFVITRGPNQQMMAALDADGTVSVTGGTLIVLGYARVRTGSDVKSYSLSLQSAGEHTVTADGVSYTFTNLYSYGRTLCYSSVTVK
ncbi:MAG: carbohydrate-binding domain-containing protein [Clostridia bacterium]|nr:carbohydrate-binding domain-containing protein [Clostridia bacterium]